MSSKIVGWLVGVRDGKILGLKKKIRNLKKNSRINQEMVNTIFLPARGHTSWRIKPIFQCVKQNVFDAVFWEDFFNIAMLISVENYC